jgi:hypothetical protein
VIIDKYTCMFGFFMLKTVYFTIYTYLHQLFAMFSGRLQHLPEKKQKIDAGKS